MTRARLLNSFLALSAACVASSALAAASDADQSAFAAALETATSIPAFRTSLLARISTVDSLSSRPAPSLSQDAAPTPQDPYRAEAALLVAAMVAQPEIVALHPAAVRSALGEKAAAQLDDATVRLQVRAQNRPKLAAQLQRFRRSLDLNDVDSMREFAARLTGSSDGSAPRMESAPALAAPTNKKKTASRAEELLSANDLAPLPSAPVPTARYTASIKTDAKGRRSLWVRIPRSAAGQEKFYSLGPVATIKKGTILFHWGDQDVDSILAAGKIDAAALNKRILQDSGSTDDLWGGGFYMSSLVADSATSGSRGIYNVLSRDMEVVTTETLPPTNRLNFVLAIRKAGLDAFQESSHQSWFNIVRAEPLSAGFKEVDFPTAVRALRAEEPAQAVRDLLVFDQRYPVSLAKWPEDLCTPLRNLMTSRSLSADDQALLIGAVGGASTAFLAIKIQTNGRLKPTRLFKAFDQFVKQTLGSSLLDM